MKRILLGCFFAVSTIVQSANEDWQEHYLIENIPIPKEIDPQIGGLTFLKDGRLAAVFHRGEVMIYSPIDNSWSEYAKGLHEPLGVIEDETGALVVAQMPELTRLVDEDGDGKADFYQTLSDDFGMSGNYHEFTFGPAKDKQGNMYIALNVASNYAGIFEHIRGDFSPIGLSREEMTNWQNDSWKKTNKFKAGRMFSKVNHRGWILKITPSGETVPYALGLRSPDGLHVDEQNRLWATDNQGDWLGTSPLYLIEEGHFYGHPASLLWKKGWKKDPVQMPATELDQIRTPASALFPHGELANSPTQPISTIDPQLFGLPKGELLIGDMNQGRLIRFLPDEVNGFTQGTLIPFLESEKLGIGNHRFSFDKDGALWLGKTHLGWAGGEGIRKVTWNKKPMLLASKVKQTKHGFVVHFNQPIKDAFEGIKVSSHSYHYHAKYGSEKVNLKEVDLEGIFLNEDKKSLSIHLAELTKNRLYTIELSSVISHDGQPLMGNTLRYNLVEKITTDY